MGIRYIFARSGKGKSYYIHQDIRKALLNHGNESLILLVPEQYTLQAERDLIAALGSRGIMQVEVMSFSSLGRRVLQDAGGLTRVVLNEQGKIMVIKKIIEENAKHLSIYRTACRQEGFVLKLSQLFSQVKKEDVDLSALIESSQAQSNRVLEQKLNDIQLLYDAFNDYLAGRYLDPDDQVNLYIEKMQECSFLRGARIWLDGFTTFSSQSLRLLEQILDLAADISISFSMSTDANQRDAELFQLSRRSYTRIHEMALKKGLSEKRMNLNTDLVNTLKPSEIIHVEAELYAYPFKKYEQKPEYIHLNSAGNIYQEVQTMACQLVQMARQEGYRWSDMAVICNDMDLYGGGIRRVFDEHKIPYFMDQKRDIMNNPIIRLVLSLMDVVDQNYRYRDVFALLKTGLTGFDPAICERLENYVLAYGIEGERWKHPFVRGEEASLEELNTVRQALLDLMQDFENAVKGEHSVIEFSQLLYEQVEHMGVNSEVQSWLQRLRRQGKLEQVYETTQVWNIFLDMLDQIVEIMGDQSMNLRSYKRILEAGFQSYELGIIPTSVDQVLVGSIQRSKSRNVQILFVLGVNDGVLPSLGTNESLLSDEEISIMLMQGFEWMPDRQGREQEEQFLIYSAITKTERYLYLSYAQADDEGRALRPSILVQRFLLLFPQLEVQQDLLEREHPLKQISTAHGSFRGLVSRLRADTDGKPIHPAWWDVYDWYFKNPDWNPACLRIIEALFYSNQPGEINKTKLEAIFPSPFYTSVSRFERYAACPFGHFVYYGLRPYPREIYELAMPDIGQLFHQGLQNFGQRIEKEKDRWEGLSQERCEDIVDEIMQELVPEHANGVLNSTYRYQYLNRRLTRICKRAAWTLTEHIQKGDFEPYAYELRFGRRSDFPPISLDLDNGKRILLEGRIDRLDVLPVDDTRYLKVIDYKTGQRNMDLSGVYHGINIQLFVYLTAALRGMSNDSCETKPAGVFYFPIHDPFLESTQARSEEAARAVRRQLRLNGFALNNVQVLEHMDHGIAGGSDVIPVSLKKDGNVSANSSVLNEEDFNLLIRHVESMLKGEGEDIVQGKIKIEPAKQGNRFTACARCDFAAICQFDPLLADNRYRYLKLLNKPAVLREIQGGVDCHE